MKTIAFIVGMLALSNVSAQTDFVQIGCKKLFLFLPVSEGVWTKSLLQKKYALRYKPTNEGRKQLWDETNRILNEFSIQIDFPHIDYSHVYDGFDLTDSVTVLEAMDRAGMDLNLVYLLPDYFMFVRLGENINYIHLEKMTFRERMFFQQYQEEYTEPVVVFSI